MIPLELWRCYDCKKLHLNKLYLERVPAQCDCGSTRITKPFGPSSLLERLKVKWWQLTVR